MSIIFLGLSRTKVSLKICSGVCKSRVSPWISCRRQILAKQWTVSDAWRAMSSWPRWRRICWRTGRNSFLVRRGSFLRQVILSFFSLQNLQPAKTRNRPPLPAPTAVNRRKRRSLPAAWKRNRRKRANANRPTPVHRCRLLSTMFGERDTRSFDANDFVSGSDWDVGICWQQPCLPLSYPKARLTHWNCRRASKTVQSLIKLVLCFQPSSFALV